MCLNFGTWDMFKVKCRFMTEVLVNVFWGVSIARAGSVWIG